MPSREWIDTAEVAKLIRKELKQAFPVQRFSVKSSRYAGGSSIDVSWTDGPTTKLVEERIGHFHGSTFDGMIDLKSYHDTEHDGRMVHFGNDFLFCHRGYSPAFFARVAREASGRLGWPIPESEGEACKVQILGDWGNSLVRQFAEDRTGGHRFNHIDCRRPEVSLRPLALVR